MLDPDTPFTEAEFATVSLALKTDLSETSIRHMVNAAYKKRVKKTKVIGSQLHTPTLQKAIVKTTLVYLNHHIDLSTLIVLWHAKGSDMVFSFAHTDGVLDCVTTYSRRARLSSYAQGGFYEHDNPNCRRFDTLVWAHQEQSKDNGAEKKATFKFCVDPDEYVTEAWRHYRIDLYRDPAFSKSGSIKFTYDRRRGHWFHVFEARGLASDIGLVADVSADFDELHRYDCSIEAAKRFLSVVGFIDATETADDQPSTEERPSP